MFLAFSILFGVDTVKASTDDEVQSQVTAFLTQVAGFDEDSISFSSFNVSRSTLMGSTTQQLIVNAIITSDNQDFSLAITLVHEKVVFYVLDLMENHLSEQTQISIEESLTIAKNSLQIYETLFDADYAQELIQILPTVLSSEEAIIENDNTCLTIKYFDASENELECASFSWIKKVGATKVPNLSISFSIANNGILTKFFDNLELYTIVVADDLLSEEQALSLGAKYIDKYAEEHDRKIVSVEAEFHYSRDFNCNRGDSYTLYPQWAVSANFSETNKEGVYGYSVLIWADTGEVHQFEPQGNFIDNTVINKTSLNSLLVVVGITLTLVVLLIAAIRIHKRNNFSASRKIKNSFFQNIITLSILSLLCSLSLLPICSASPSFIFGSRADVAGFEVTIDSTLAGHITSASSAAGYTANNWYGESTTSSNLYLAAYNNGSLFSISFYIGHGDDGSSSGWWCFTWPWHYHDTMAMYDDSGNWVRDNTIYVNSADENPNGKKVVVFWSCHLGEDAIGSIRNFPCRVDYHGMPLAWNHDLSLSLNGYNASDSSGQAFIGWIGEAPYLSSDLFDVEDMGYNFLLRFYWATLVDGRTINAGLDYASNELFGVSYGNCDLYTGFDGGRQMLVYGQGSLYL